MTVKLQCEACKKEFEAPEDLFVDFKWPKCNCGKPLTILGENISNHERISNTPSSDGKPMVRSRSSSKPDRS